jgi:response regulator RpfG family c-di-GMP phosphodiesterase
MNENVKERRQDSPLSHPATACSILQEKAVVDDHEALSRAVKTYVTTPLERNEFVTKAASKAWTKRMNENVKERRQDSPLSHPATACSILQEKAAVLTKWVYSMEVDVAGQQPSNEELQLVDDLRSLLAEAHLVNRRAEERDQLASRSNRTKRMNENVKERRQAC